MDMDRKIEAPKRNRKKIVIGAVCVAFLLAGYQVLSTASTSSTKVDRSKLTISKVKVGSFAEYLPLRGQVMPIDTIYLDTEEGGRVEAVHLEEGAQLKKGDLILTLGNNQLQLDAISREAQISEQMNNLRNTQLAFEQNRLSLKRQIIQVEYRLGEMKPMLQRRLELSKQKLISEEDYRRMQEEFEFQTRTREILLESQSQEDSMRGAQMNQLQDNLKHLQANLSVARKNLDNLAVRAPIDGQLTMLTAKVGESKAKGQRLGQVDVLSAVKVEALVDEFYITRLQIGQAAQCEISGKSYVLAVKKIYSEVVDGQVKVDFSFKDGVPADITRGQTFQIGLQLSEPNRAKMLARGGFFQDTGGTWAFVVSPDGRSAERREIKLGRKNVGFFEVLEGLKENEAVVTSSYDHLVNVTKLEFNNVN